MERLNRVLSPVALLVSVLALVAATAGVSAYAATKITTKQIKNGAVTEAKLAKNSVSTPKIKNGGVTAPKIKNGTITMADLAPATANRLAKPAATAVIDPFAGPAIVRGAGFTSVTRPATGVYCLAPHPSSGINLATIVPSVSTELWYSGVADTVAHWSVGTNPCPAARLQVRTYRIDSVGEAAPSNGVAFTVVVPR